MSIVEYIDAEKFQKDINYSMSDLDTAVLEQAGLAAYYGAKAALAKRQASNSKLKLQTISAQVYKIVRDALEESGKKATESTIKAMVDTDKNVVNAKASTIEAVYYEDLGMTTVDAFRHRRDMLKELGMASRAERFSDPTVMAKEGEKNVLNLIKK
jgi:hypothetical protein